MAGSVARATPHAASETTTATSTLKGTMKAL